MQIIQEMNCPVKITWKWGITFVPSFICWKIIFDLEISGNHFVFDLGKDFRPWSYPWINKIIPYIHFQIKSHVKEVLHMFLSLFVKNCIFASFTLKLSFWPWRWPWVIKIIQEMDFPVKITWKWGITLVPGFICWKIIFDLEIFGGHFVFALKKFRSRVPKWHPADSCSGHPLEPESIIKHRPYRETRLSKKMPFDNWTIIFI